MVLARWQGVVQDAQGNIVPGASVEVRREGGDGALVQLYADRRGLQTLGNPFTVDPSGLAAFHTQGGAYRVRAYTGDSVSPSFEVVWRFVAVGTTQEHDVDDLGAALYAGIVPFATSAELIGYTPTSDVNVGAMVLNDPDPAQNGFWVWDDVGSVWSRERGFADTLALLTVTGGINSVAAVSRPGVDPSQVLAYVIQPETTNTGPVNLSIDGAPSLPVRDVNGDPLAAGLWTAGRLILIVPNGDEYRLLSDPDADGAAAAAADAADRAEDAAQRAEDAASTITNTVTYNPQTPTPEQQRQARENIGVTPAPVYQSAAEPQGITIPEQDSFITLSEGGVPGSHIEWSDAGTSDPSSPGQIEVDVEGVTHFYTRSNKVLRPQQFGARLGGTPADNRAALLEMFALADQTGRTIDMGDARDVYEISSTLSYTWGSRPCIRGDGATVKLMPTGSEQTYGVYMNTQDHGFDLEGFGVDGNKQTPNPLWVENTTANVAPPSRAMGLHAIRGHRATNTSTAGRGISIRGWHDYILAQEMDVRDQSMAVGAVAPGVHGIIGLFIGQDTSGRCPLQTDIVDPYIDNITSEDSSVLIDQDGISVLLPDPAGSAIRKRYSASVRGGKIRNARTRGIKFQAFNPLVSGTRFEITDPNVDTSVVNLWIDFQWGSGIAVDCQGYASAESGWMQAIGGTARPGVNGDMVVRDCKLASPAANKFPMARFAARSADDGHAAGSLRVEGCSGDHNAQLIGHIARFVSRINGETLLVLNNHFRQLSTAGADLFRWTSAGTMDMIFTGNVNKGAAVPVYTTTNFTPTIRGGAGSSIGFS